MTKQKEKRSYIDIIFRTTATPVIYFSYYAYSGHKFITNSSNINSKYINIIHYTINFSRLQLFVNQDKT